MECVPGSTPLDKVKSDILGYFRQFPENIDPEAPFGIRRDVMTTYVKSCAGYCVITYILMVGDRHFDNILIRVRARRRTEKKGEGGEGEGVELSSFSLELQRTGHLFHIDFGYIFGKDPKPLPPPMKITKQMIDGMGGPESSYYENFLQYCCQAYNIIRKNANLFLNLLNLMRDANIPDMEPDPDRVIDKVRENFQLQMDDEAAEKEFLKVLDDSVAALFPHISDFIHTIATRLR